MMTNEYFTFDDAARAIRIHRFDTPQPWINYLSNGSFHALVSQAGGGFAWWKTPVLMRLTRYRQFHLPLDTPGFYVYIRHPDGTVWSPTFRPCETPLDAWEACHQGGRSTFTAEKDGIRATLTLFVPPDYDALVWDLTLTRREGGPAEVDVFAYVEHSQMNWDAEHSWGYYIKLMVKTWFDAASRSMNYLCHAGNPREKESPLVFLGSSAEVDSSCGSRNDFTGDYRSERNPVAVERGRCGNETINCGEAASALHNPVRLAVGKAVRLLYVLGVAPRALVDLPAAEVARDAMLKSLTDPAVVDAQAAKLDAWWQEQFGAMQCSIPDPAAERQINTWNVINSVHVGRYSRSVNTVAPGIRGIGFRDTCQDLLAVAYRRPQSAFQTLCFLLSQQYRDGHTVHYAFPEEKRPPVVTIHSDNHLWLPLAAYAIFSETGDLAPLETPVDFLGSDHLAVDGQGTVWEHLMAAMRFTDTNLGVHAIPLTFHSDWNDIIGRFNRHGKGETVFAGMQYALCLRHMVELAAAAGKPELAWLQDCLRRQEQALLACAWDGGWWRRGFDDDGVPVGSEQCECGKLFLNPQSWAVLSGIGDRRQQEAGMSAANAQLDTDIGLKILTPSFSSWGGTEKDAAKTGYGPGCGENGAIFCHANTWAVMAEALLGNADRAWKYFTQLIPANAMRTVGIKRYRAEPYAWVSNIVGPDNPRHGWANVEQITGTAPWMDVASTQYLLGIRPTLKGLLIDPCIPREWKEFRVRRRWRGCQLDIHVVNASGTGKGIRTLEIDGSPVKADALPGLITPEMLVGRPRAEVRVVL
jgi:cellobiose phosphorylase